MTFVDEVCLKKQLSVSDMGVDELILDDQKNQGSTSREALVDFGLVE